MNAKPVFFFLGIDPAPAQQKSSDDGALSVLRAMASVEDPAGLSDWQTDFVYDRVVRGYDLDQWSGLIHEKHMDFGFSCIVLDWGGGGQWLWKKLGDRAQKVRGVETNCRPIVPRDHAELDAAAILSFVLRRDSGMQALWATELAHAQGDDVLKTHMHTLFREAWTKETIGVPARHEEVVKMTASDGSPLAQGWPEEKEWASRMGSQALQQMGAFSVATRADGAWDTTKNGALRFLSSERDDLVDSRRNAYVAFRIWWQEQSEGGFHVKPEDDAGCW